MNKNRDISATFMFTDIVGYSAIINKNQSLALQLLDKHNKILLTAIEKNNGNIIKHTGDGYFVYFQLASDAIKSAIEFQTKIKNQNEISQKKYRFHVRVGINSGNAVKKNNDFFGHDVNVASRIEGISVFGGIAISDNVYTSIKDKNIFSRKMGYVKMRNIRNPQLLHNLYLSKEDWKSQTDNELIHHQLKRGINIIDINEYKIQNTYSVGVLYFNSLGSDAQKRISHNLSEDIMSDFEKINDVRTASKLDVLKFTNISKSIHEIANKLKVNNILKGEMFFENNKMRLNIKLFSTSSGDYIFEEMYECNINNSNFLRTKVLTRIMKEFDLETPPHILESLSRKMSENSIALESYNQGKYYIERLGSKEDIKKAHKLFKEAYKLDSHFIEALTQYGLSFQKLGEFEEAEECLEKALIQAQNEKYDAGIALIYNCMGTLYYVWGKIKLSLKYYEKAIDLQNKLDDNFQEAKILSNISEHYILLNDVDKALSCLERSQDIKIELEEMQSLAYTFSQFGNLYLRLEDYSKSLEYLEKTIAISEEHDMRQLQSQRVVDLAICYENLGFLDKALSYIDTALPMLEEFDNVMAIGRSYLIKGQVMRHKGNLKASINHINNSIEEFQMCDQKWLVLIANIELAITHICDENHKNAETCLNKVFTLGKRIKGFEIWVLLAKILQVSFNADKNPDDFYKELKSYNSEPATYKHWYYLSESYANLNKVKKANECIEISKKLLKERSLKNSNKEHQKSMLNNIPLHQKIINF